MVTKPKVKISLKINVYLCLLMFIISVRIKKLYEKERYDLVKKYKNLATKHRLMYFKTQDIVN